MISMALLHIERTTLHSDAWGSTALQQKAVTPEHRRCHRPSR